MLNLLHLCKICCLDSIGHKLHGHMNSSLGKNLSQYSLIGAWLMIALVALAYNIFEWPKCWSQRLFLIVNSSRGLDLSSRSSRKFFPLLSDTWKNILHCERIELQSHFLQKSQDNLHERLGDKLKLLECLSTAEYSSQFSLLEQS